MGQIFLTVGGPTRQIAVDGVIYSFEDHPRCGPCLLDGNEDPVEYHKSQDPFLDAASLWIQQGRKMADDGLCEWWKPSEPITVQLDRRNAIVTGWTEPTRGC